MENTREDEAEDDGVGQPRNFEHMDKSWGSFSVCRGGDTDLGDSIDGGSHTESNTPVTENEVQINTPGISNEAELSDTENKIISPLQKYLIIGKDERALIQGELAEDIRIAKEIFPEMLEGGDAALMHRDIAFYPGHRQIARLKEKLRQDRGWVKALAECSEGNNGSGKKRRRNG